MSAIEDGLAARAAWARDVALFRYGMIRAAADPDLSPRQRGALVRALAAGEHKGPGGQPVRHGRSTLDRWIRDWRAGGVGAPVARGRPASTRARAGSRCGMAGPPWTGGSGTGGPAGSTR